MKPLLRHTEGKWVYGTHVIDDIWSIFFSFITTHSTKSACSKTALTTDIKTFSSSQTLPLAVPLFVSRLPSQADKVEAMSQGSHA